MFITLTRRHSATRAFYLRHSENAPKMRFAKGRAEQN
jgi:hypothetical protein